MCMHEKCMISLSDIYKSLLLAPHIAKRVLIRHLVAKRRHFQTNRASYPGSCQKESSGQLGLARFGRSHLAEHCAHLTRP